MTSASMFSNRLQRSHAKVKNSLPVTSLIHWDADFVDYEKEAPTPTSSTVTVLPTSTTLLRDHDSKVRCDSNGSDASTEPGSGSEAESCGACVKKAVGIEDEVRNQKVESLNTNSYNSPSWSKKSSLPKVSAKVSLASSPTSWFASQQQRRLRANYDTNLPLTEEDFGRKARGILNKLTLERFEALYEQLASCGIECPQHLTVLVQEIFEKAITQHHFIPMYGELCKRLEADDRIVASGTEANTNNSFRRMLLNQCESSFNAILTGGFKSDAEVQHDEEVEEARLRSKARVLGNIHFIGRLLVQGMLASKLLISVANELLRSYPVCDDWPLAFECLAALLTVAGPTFDADATWQWHTSLSAIFNQIETLAKDHSLPSRVRFLLRDVLDLRAAGWNDNRAATNQTARPKKLDIVQSPKISSAAPWRRNRTNDKNTPLLGKSNVASSAKSRSTVAVTLDNRIASGPVLSSPCPSSTPPITASVPATMKIAMLPPTVPCQPCEQTSFSISNFHKELWAAMRTLIRDCDLTKAVSRIKMLDVPPKHQAEEFADILARVTDEPDANARKIFLQFAAHLGAPDTGAFDTSECLEGVKIFFNEIVNGLCEEDPELHTVVKVELLPALRTKLPEVQLCLGVAHHVWLLE